MPYHSTRYWFIAKVIVWKEHQATDYQCLTMMMLSSWLSLSSALLLLVRSVEGGNAQFNPVESMFGGTFLQRKAAASPRNFTFSSLMEDPNAPTPEEREAEREARRLRQRERNAKVKETMKYMRPDTSSSQVEKLSEEEIQEHPALRNLGWGRSSSNATQFVDPGEDYDMWQQAYRMLGGFIDCDHAQDGDGGSGDGGVSGCSRWMLWAAVSFIYLRVMEDEKVKGMSRLTYLDSFILVRSTLTPTTRVADTMSILEMMLLEV
jgi:hypothetical protein